MDITELTAHLSRHAQVIAQMTHDVSDEQARWRPDADSWSILEVINHLYDEEREDFRAFIQHIWDDGGKWPGINPQSWVTERGYNQRDIQESTINFLYERELSLQWLRDLDAPDWDATCETLWGHISAGDVMAAWVAHDLLHIRQLTELHYAYTQQLVSPYVMRYAGEW